MVEIIGVVGFNSKRQNHLFLRGLFHLLASPSRCVGVGRAAKHRVDGTVVRYGSDHHYPLPSHTCFVED